MALVYIYIYIYIYIYKRKNNYRYRIKSMDYNKQILAEYFHSNSPDFNRCKV